MSRYRPCRQRNEMGCSPVAFLNALKWIKPGVTYASHYRILCDQLRTTNRNGTWCGDIFRVAADYGFTRVYKPHERVEGLLRDQRPLIFNIITHSKRNRKKLRSHTVFSPGMVKQRVSIANLTAKWGYVSIPWWLVRRHIMLAPQFFYAIRVA